MDVKLINLLCRNAHGLNYNRLEMVWYVQGGEHSGMKNKGYHNWKKGYGLVFV